MLGVLVNALAILAGGSVGLLAKKGIPEKITNAIMTAIALCVIYIGVSGMLKGENTLVLIVSMVLGTAVGTLLDLDGRIERLGGRIERRFQRGGKRPPIAEGFVTASLLFCVGAMAILGSFNAGLKQDYELLFTKSLGSTAFHLVCCPSRWGWACCFPPCPCSCIRGCLPFWRT